MAQHLQSRTMVVEDMGVNMNKSEKILNRMKKKLGQQCGFTLLELVLSIVIGGAMFGLAAQTLMSQADTYAFIANRKTSIADMRFAMNKISHEILRLESGDIQGISATGMSFTDENGLATSITLGANGAGLAIYRGNDILVEDVSSLDFEYQDENGDILPADDDEIGDVRRIKVTITTEPKGDEGEISVSTTVVPRSFIGYANYE